MNASSVARYSLEVVTCFSGVNSKLNKVRVLSVLYSTVITKTSLSPVSHIQSSFCCWSSLICRNSRRWLVEVRLVKCEFTEQMIGGREKLLFGDAQPVKLSAGGWV